MPAKLVRLLSTSVLLVLSAILVRPAAAGDWPQILGLHRNAVADGEKLAESWPTDGPKVRWEKSLGTGLSGVVVARGRVIVYHRIDDNDVIEALDAKTGKPIWKTSHPTGYVPRINPDDGPRAVPLIHGDAVYVYSAEGRLSCVSFAQGKKRWSRELNRELRTPLGYFGAGSTPIVAGGKLLVNVGARNGAAIVAVDLKTGKTIWNSFKDAASYSSPTLAKIGGKEHVVFLTRLNVVSLDAANGNVLFQFPFGQSGTTVNGANPLVVGNNVFVTASYGIGAAYAKITPKGATVVWKNDTSMSSQYTTCVASGGYLYGSHGRYDGPPAALRCIDPATGKVMWSEDNFGTVTLILADGKLVIVGTEGQIVLAQATPKRFHELARATAFETRDGVSKVTVRPLPALADGHLYIRDTKTLKCFDLSAAK